MYIAAGLHQHRLVRVACICFAAAKSGVCTAKWPPAGGVDSSEAKPNLAA